MSTTTWVILQIWVIGSVAGLTWLLVTWLHQTWERFAQRRRCRGEGQPPMMLARISLSERDWPERF